jgi:hypothetical protein
MTIFLVVVAIIAMAGSATIAVLIEGTPELV